MNKLIFVTLVIFAVLLPSVYSFGLGISPSIIRLDNALKGQEYKSSLRISVMSSEDIDVSLEGTGDAGSWIHFYDAIDQTKEISTLKVHANSYSEALVIFKIPEDAANGKYSAKILAKKAGEQGEGDTTMAVSVVSSSVVSIDVTGEQFLKGNVRSITIQDVETGQPLRIKVDFENQGNVKATPKIEAKLMQNTNSLDTITLQNDTLDVNGIKIIEVEWPTEGRGTGNFSADVAVYLGDEKLKQETIEFGILARGTLSAEGYLGKELNPSTVSLGKPAKLGVEFINNGKIDVKAKLAGEVYVGNDLVSMLTSEDVLVKMSEKKEIYAYFTPSSEGKYTVKRWVSFEGKKIDLPELKFELSKNGAKIGDSAKKTNSSQSPELTMTIIIAVLIVAIVTIFGYMFWKK